MYGEKFYRSEFVILDFQSDDLPLFGKIEEILVVASNLPLLAVKIYRTEGINVHIDGYQVSPTNKIIVVLLSNIKYKHSFASHTFIGDGFLYIVSKSHFLTLIHSFFNFFQGKLLLDKTNYTIILLL